MSLTWSETALIDYLYGYDFKWRHNESGKLVITPERITEHVWGRKRILRIPGQGGHDSEIIPVSIPKLIRSRFRDEPGQ
jgi:hypothetical protein